MEVFPHNVSDSFGKCLSTFLIRLNEEDTVKKTTQLKKKNIAAEEKKKTTLQTLQDNASATAKPKPKLTAAAVSTTFKPATAMRTKKNYQGNCTTPSSTDRPSIARRASASLEAAASMSLKERMAAYQKQSSVDADVAAIADKEEKFHVKEGKASKDDEGEVNHDKDTAVGEQLPDKAAPTIEQSKAQDNAEPVQEQAKGPSKQPTTKTKKKKSLTSFLRKKK